METKTFNQMTRAEKRVAIAQDVLKQLRTKKYVAERDLYVSVEFKGDTDNNWNARFDDVKSNIHKVKECRVCAIGSCIVSATRLGNTLTFREMEDERDPKTRKLLAKAFTQKQLYLMESAFELNINSMYTLSQGYAYGPNTKTEDEAVKARNFGYKYNDSTDRLKAIMRNVIKNNGEFKP